MTLLGTRGFIIVASLIVSTAAGPALAQNVRCPDRAIKAGPETIDGSSAHVYKTANGVDLRLHVFSPTPRGPQALPAIVLFTGGGWMSADVTALASEATYFAARGMIAILADYRTFCRDGVDVTGEMADARSAVRWTRAHARELAIDPNRIVASGTSSGGHLAVSTALFSDFDDPSDDKAISAVPNALVLFFPCVDLTTDVERQYSAPALGNHGQDVSPAYHLRKDLQPMVILQGTADELYGNVKTFAAKVASLGNSVEFFTYEGAPHGFLRPTINDGKWRREALLQADRFLTKHGYLPSPSPSVP